VSTLFPEFERGAPDESDYVHERLKPGDGFLFLDAHGRFFGATSRMWTAPFSGRRQSSALAPSPIVLEKTNARLFQKL
jgi:hypothetical protein